MIRNSRTFGRSMRFVGTYGFGIVFKIRFILSLLDIICAIDMMAYMSALFLWIVRHGTRCREKED